MSPTRYLLLTPTANCGLHIADRFYLTAAMERSESCSSQFGQRSPGYDDSSSSLPPWEQRNVAQVPYMGQHSQPLTYAERQAIQSPSAAIEQEEPVSARPTIHGYGHLSFDNGYPLPRHDREDGWATSTLKTAPPFTAARSPPLLPVTMPRQPQLIPQAPSSANPIPATMPRQSHMIPQVPKYAPAVRSFMAMPPSPPPDNTCLSRSSTTSSTQKSVSISSPTQSPRLPQHMIPSLPGTMSTSERAISPKRSFRPKREESAKKEKPEAAPFGKRFKLAMKDIFKREPIDESQLEHISDRHWTDE